jgi:hypothetical protein
MPSLENAMQHVIYRTGGTENFKWVEAAPAELIEAAEATRARLETAGYPAFVLADHERDHHGLPTSYDAAPFLAMIGQCD